MTSYKVLNHLLTVLLVLFACVKSNGQQIDEKTYYHKMQLMDSISLYKMKNYDTLYEISTLDTSRGNNFKSNYHGWIANRNRENIQLVDIHAELCTIDKRRITKIAPMAITDTTIELLVKPDRHSIFDLGSAKR